MTGIQKFFKTILPKSWGKSMERESRLWTMKCKCGYEISVWDAGGIRWKAAGKKKVWGRCTNCNNKVWFTVYKKEPFFH